MNYSHEILDAANSEHPIAYERFIIWTKSTSLEDLQILSELIFKKSFYNKISPFLSINDYQNLLLRYYRRCIIENPKDDDLTSRYEACWELLSLFNNLWKDKEKNHKQLLEIKEYFSDLYLNGDKEIQYAIIYAVLEHLFENIDIRKFFYDWKDRSLLGDAYKSACLFGDAS
jgi:hypothetical protein